MTNIGPHLLGCIPSPKDDRDLKLSYFIGDDDTLFSRAMWHLQQTTVGYKNKYWQEPPYSTHWAKALVLLNMMNQNWRADGDVIWRLDRVLDQGNTPHCVGFSWAAWSNAEPYSADLDDKVAHDIYYEIKEIEGEPRQENGAYIRSGAKAMQYRKRLDLYAFASNLSDVIWYLRCKGPVVVGTEWTYDMFKTNSAGYVRPTGSSAGGHAYLLIGDLPSEKSLLFQNSWGADWGIKGRFKMTYDDFEKLSSRWAEIVASLELPNS
ncbi:MAG: C1 family peptidase [Nitrososphaerales archaeon]